MYSVNSIKFKFLLAKYGYTIVSLARILKMNDSYINQVVNGKRSPSPVLAKNIAEILNVEITDIFTIDNH